MPITTVIMLDSKVHISEVGFIPTFIDSDDPRSAVEQLDANYWPGGWRPQKGFKLDLKTNTLHYPGDPPFKAIAMILLRNEMVLIFRYGYVAVVTPGDGPGAGGEKFEVCRMD